MVYSRKSYGVVYKYFMMLYFLSSFFTLEGQRIIVNSNGERIIMFPDGSWRLAEPGDSILINRNLQKTEALGQPGENADQSINRTAGEYEEYLLRQWNELHFKIKAQEKKIQNEFRAATNAQFSAAEIYHNAEANKDVIEPDRLAQINENYQESIRKLRTANANQKAIKRIFEESKNLANVPADKLERKLNSLRSKFNSFMVNYSGDKSYVASPEITAPPKEKVKSKPPKTPNVKAEKEKGSDAPIIVRKPEQNKEPVVASNKNLSESAGKLPPARRVNNYVSEPYRCITRTDTVDAITGQRKVELEPALIFTHTDPDLRPFFKNKELITCYGKLSRIDAYVYFTIDFEIASSHSQSNFGSLQKGSLLRLHLLDGEFVSLYNLRTDNGRIDAYTGHTVFTGQYAIGKNEIKALLSSELDKVRILWSTGYEDYDVYKVDFFLDRLNCLMSK